VHEEVDDAAEFAEKSPEPTEEALYRNCTPTRTLYFDGAGRWQGEGAA
jgi:TPP-dependent pyruvate/acetoin dehydrogenase alpha subunit